MSKRFLKNKNNIKKGGNNEQKEAVVLDYYDNIAERAEIMGHHGSQYIKFKLRENEMIITSLSSLIYMDSNIDKGAIQFDGFMSGFKNLFSGEDFFYNGYKGINPEKEGVVAVGTNTIDSVVRLKVKNNFPLKLSRNSFIASTDNIKIDATTNMKGIIGIGQEEGFILPTATCISGDHGYVWIAAFGIFEKMIIPQGEHIIINNGTFLASHVSTDYEVVKLGKTMIGSFINGEGFGMKFTGPTIIYIQTKNLNDFIATFQSQDTTFKMGDNNMSSVAETSNSFFNLF
jgi:uncharacterized protein (AIM24 family)